MNKAKFWDRIADRYSKQPVANEAAYQKKLEVTRSYFTPDMRVVEIGCGTGSTAIAHSPYVEHIHAYDVSEKMLEIARGKAEAADIKNVTFEQSSVEDLEIPDGSVDAVMAHSILHLLEDKDAAIGQIHRMLKPGGLFISSTVCLGDKMWYLQPIIAIGSFFGFLPMVKFLNRKEFVSSIEDGGFAIDHEWVPEKGGAVFLVAKKSD